MAFFLFILGILYVKARDISHFCTEQVIDTLFTMVLRSQALTIDSFNRSI